MDRASPVRRPSDPGGNAPGAASRVAAAGNLFEAFVPVLDSNNLPTSVYRYESTDGVNWTEPSQNPLFSFGEPMNESPNELVGPTGSACAEPNPCPIFYALNLAASGYTNGQWSVAFQVNNGGYNNVYICTSDRGCGLVNAAATDQFLAGTSVSGDGGYWVAYLTYSTLVTRQVPLIARAICFPAGQAPIGATTKSGIDPTTWQIRYDGSRCTAYCFAAGDFNTVASNPYAAASTPFVAQDSRQTNLFQSFLEDPDAVSTGAFKPNFVPYPAGANLVALARILPGTAQAYHGVPPSKKIGIAQPAR